MQITEQKKKKVKKKKAITESQRAKFRERERGRSQYTIESVSNGCILVAAIKANLLLPTILLYIFIIYKIIYDYLYEKYKLINYFSTYENNNFVYYDHLDSSNTFLTLLWVSKLQIISSFIFSLSKFKISVT